MKPGDFYLGVVNFLGVLVPGAILLLLRGWTFPTPGDVVVPRWLVFGGASYVVGQFLLAATEILNVVGSLGLPFWRRVHDDVGKFRKAATEGFTSMSLGSEQSQFHTALSYLRTKNAEAAAEVDHHMADYKLLRNLLAVLCIDLAARAVIGPREPWIFIGEALSIVVCLVAFGRMFNWAQLFSFQYVCLIRDVGIRKEQPKSA